MGDLLALKVHDQDNVATVFANEVKAGMVINVRDKKGRIFPVELRNDLPYGHKLAIEPIKKGTPVRKYGEEIGVATQDIAPGEHVHVHNMDSQRGRGDLERG
ncbi:MAG TPA: UxaA family hydrolase [Capillibacterium sp.]